MSSGSDDEKWYTTGEAAKVLGVTPESVRQYVGQAQSAGQHSRLGRLVREEDVH